MDKTGGKCLIVLYCVLLLLFPALCDKQQQPVDNVALGDEYRSQGNFKEALSRYDEAVETDPNNYLVLFKRGVTYMMLGRDSRALEDWDSVLKLQPDFEGAHVQKSRLNLKLGRYDLALEDAGGKQDLEQVIKSTESEAVLAQQSFESGEFENCVEHVSAAIKEATRNPSLRRLSVRCRLALGDTREAMRDLTSLLSLTPEDVDTFVEIARIYYFLFNEPEHALKQLRRCLLYDPDCKECKKAHREIRKYDKKLGKLLTAIQAEPRPSSGHKVWAELEKVVVEEDLLLDLKKQALEVISDYAIGGQQQNSDYSELVMAIEEAGCEACLNTRNYKQGMEFCESVAQRNQHFTPAILMKAQQKVDSEDYDVAAQIVHQAIQSGAQDARLQQKLQELQILAKRAKSKDYYKILGVPRSADEREIKQGYRAKTREFHPDKYRGDMDPEAVEKKMAEINEAYEVLRDPELKQRYDNGDDPNNPQVHQGFHGQQFGGFQQQFQQQFQQRFQQRFQQQFQQAGNGHQYNVKYRRP